MTFVSPASEISIVTAEQLQQASKRSTDTASQHQQGSNSGSDANEDSDDSWELPTSPECEVSAYLIGPNLYFNLDLDIEENNQLNVRRLRRLAPVQEAVYQLSLRKPQMSGTCPSIGVLLLSHGINGKGVSADAEMTKMYQHLLLNDLPFFDMIEKPDYESFLYCWHSSTYLARFRAIDTDRMDPLPSQKIIDIHTPSDGLPFFFFSLAVKVDGRSGTHLAICRGAYYASDIPTAVRALLSLRPLEVRSCNSPKFRTTLAPLVLLILLPQAILKSHFQRIEEELHDVTLTIRMFEEQLRDGSLEQSAFSEVNTCRLDQSRLEKRVHFHLDMIHALIQWWKDLGIALQNQISAFDKSQYDLGRTIKQAVSETEGEREQTERLRLRLEALPRKIDNLSAVLFNFAIRQDAQTNLRIAETSARIAEEARRDSASMKTIAVLTLVFLPATSLASIFSMSMFNWGAKPGDAVVSKYIWIYFVVAAGLTLFVLAVWLAWYTWSQRKRARSALEAAADIEGRTGSRRDATPAASVGSGEQQQKNK